MKDQGDHSPRTRAQLLQEIAELRQRVADLEAVAAEQGVGEPAAPLVESNDQFAIFRKFVEASAQGFGIARLNGTITYVNPAMCRIMGEDRPEDVVGKHFFDYVAAPSLHWRGRESALFLTEQGRMLEGMLRTRQGTLTPVCANDFVLRDEQGQPTYLATVITDMTDRKQAEDALRHKREQLQAIYDGIFEGLVIVDSETKRIVRVNAALCRMLGYAEEELLAKAVADIHPNEDGAASLERIQGRIAGNIQEETNIPFLRKDGSVFYANIVGSRITYEGRPCLLGLFRDITARKQTEDALAESEEKYRMLVETSPDAVILSDLSARVIFASRRLAELYGSDDVDVFIGKTPLDFLPEEEHPRFLANLQRAVAEGYTRRTEYLFLRKDGTRIPAEVNGTIVRDASGVPTGFIVVLSDITERKEAEAAIQKEHRTLKHLLESSDHERQLIAYEIHDGLAQQLAGAIMQFQTYRHVKEARPKDAARAFDAGMTMLQQGHFEARRLISGVRPPILDESGVVAAIAHLVNEEQQQTQIRVEFHSNVAFGRLVPILENAIYRIVQEGLTNACKHSRTDRIHVELIQDGDELQVGIQDWGIGFNSATIADHCFGLEGIRERVRLLGGKAVVETAPGQGTCICVHLPLVAKE